MPCRVGLSDVALRQRIGSDPTGFETERDSTATLIRMSAGRFFARKNGLRMATWIATASRSVVTMGLNWKSVQAVHVSQACESLLHSTDSQSKPRGLIVTYKDKQLPAKTILRMAYCLANNVPSQTELKFASSESSLQLLRSLGFQAERLPSIDPVEKR